MVSPAPVFGGRFVGTLSTSFVLCHQWPGAESNCRHADFQFCASANTGPSSAKSRRCARTYAARPCRSIDRNTHVCPAVRGTPGTHQRSALQAGLPPGSVRTARANRSARSTAPTPFPPGATSAKSPGPIRPIASELPPARPQHLRHERHGGRRVSRADRRERDAGQEGAVVKRLARQLLGAQCQRPRRVEPMAGRAQGPYPGCSLLRRRRASTRSGKSASASCHRVRNA